MNLSWIGDFLKNTQQVAEVASALNTGLSALGIQTNLGASAAGLGAGASLQKAFASPDLGTKANNNETVDGSPWGTTLGDMTDFGTSDIYNTPRDLAINALEGSEFMGSIAPGMDFNPLPWDTSKSFNWDPNLFQSFGL